MTCIFLLAAISFVSYTIILSFPEKRRYICVLTYSITIRKHNYDFTGSPWNHILTASVETRSVDAQMQPRMESCRSY